MQDVSVALKRVMASKKLSQLSIARESNVSQATISRALRGEQKRGGRAFSRLAGYLEAQDSEWKMNNTSTKMNDDILSAIEEVWDETDVHARQIAVVIRALSGLKPKD